MPAERLGESASTDGAQPGTHYDYIVSEDLGTSGGWLLRLAGRNRRVLDVGCAAGGLARALVDRGCTVVGVEYDRDAAKLAELVCEHVLVADLDEVDLEVALEGLSFDVIVAGDVLEHLRDPGRTLRQLRTLIRPGGSLAVSIPNVTHGSIRLALLHGTFPRDDLGLLDRTHVQFLTRDDVITLLTDSGWLPAWVGATVKDIRDSEVPFPDDELTQRVYAEIEADPTSRIYQHLALAYPVSDEKQLEPAVQLLVDTQRELERMAGEAASEHMRADQLAVHAEHTQLHVDQLEQEHQRLVATLAEQQYLAGLMQTDLALHSLRRQAAAAQVMRAQRDRVVGQLETLKREQRETEEQLVELQARLNSVLNSRSWRALETYRRARRLLGRVT